MQRAWFFCELLQRTKNRSAAKPAAACPAPKKDCYTHTFKAIATQNHIRKQNKKLKSECFRGLILSI